MDFDCPHLSLAPYWADEDDDRRIVLVRAVDALALCRRGGYEKVSSVRTSWNFQRESHRLLWELRGFAIDIGLASPFAARYDDQELVALFGERIQHGELVGLRKAEATAAAEADPTIEQRQLVRAIESQTRGQLSEGGRRYKLVAGADVAGTPDRNSYEVVRHDEGGRVLAKLAEESSGRGELAELLAKATAKLSPDWRPPFSPKGLVLLRRIAVRAAAATSPEAAITPSQMRALMEKTSLEIHVVDLNGTPQEFLAFQIKKPDGGTESGKLDKDGRGLAKSSTPGTFTVTFPELDGADWDGDGALELPPEEDRSEASRYKVKQDDRLPSIARQKGFLRWQTVWDFAGNAIPRKQRGNAHIL